MRATPAGDIASFEIQPAEVVEIIGGPDCATIGETMYLWWEIKRVDETTGRVADAIGENSLFKPWQ